MNKLETDRGCTKENEWTRFILSGLLIIMGMATIFLLTGQTTAQDNNQPQIILAIDEDGQWDEMGSGSASGGGISNNGGDSWFPSLAIDSGGIAITAWEDYSSGDAEIYVRRWNGSAWATMGSGSASGGGISANSKNSTHPSLAIGPDNKPIIAWEDYSGGDAEIYVRRWNGSAWVEMGSGSASGGGISANNGASEFPSLAVGPDGAPIVTWSDDSSGDFEIYVRRWNGSTWATMGSGSASGGGISANSKESANPSLTISPDGTPIIAWHDYSTSSGDIYVRRWNGSTWVEMGSGSASGGGISANSGSSRRPTLAVSPAGTPIIAWEDKSAGDAEIYVRRWNGSAWVTMGSGSASGGGISANSGDSQRPTLAIRPDNAPIIAWSDKSSGSREIYVKHWNGSSWFEMGSGSASGGGISNNGAISWDPSLAVSPDGTPIVAWEYDAPANTDIYIRHWQPSKAYTLSINIEGSGTVTVDPDQSTYPAGTTVSLTANPNAGWEFAGWSGDLSGTTNPKSLLMNGNKVVTAKFEQTTNDEYTLLIAIEGSGTVTANPDQSTYPAGITVSLTANPNDGWKFAGWSGDLSGSNNPATLTMNGDKLVTALFESYDNFAYAAFFPAASAGFYNFSIYEGNIETEPNNEWRQANGALVSGRVYRGSFDSEDIDDYFLFVVPQQRLVEVTLWDIPKDQDYDLILRNQKRESLAFPNLPGQESETISMDLPVGFYYVQVNNYEKETHSDQYSLKVVFE